MLQSLVKKMRSNHSVIKRRQCLAPPSPARVGGLGVQKAWSRSVRTGDRELARMEAGVVVPQSLEGPPGTVCVCVCRAERLEGQGWHFFNCCFRFWISMSPGHLSTCKARSS